MSESARPPMKQVQRSLLIGALIGIIFGCVLGSVLGVYYAWQVSPATYSGGAFPRELTQGYQNEYVAMVVDSYMVTGQLDAAQERLKTFDDATQIRYLGAWSATYVAGGRAAEAEAVNRLAVELKQAAGWTPETISTVVGQLANEFKDDSAKAQAINTYALALGQVPMEGQPAQPSESETAPAEPTAQPGVVPGGGIFRWQTAVLCCLGLILILLIAFILYKRLAGSKGPAKPEEVWEGEGSPPLRSWSATYNLGQDNYDDQINIETPDKLLAGGVGVGISEAVSKAVIPGTSPKQVTAFDVWVFDKTDITNYAKVIMSEQAFRDESNRAAIEADAQVEAVLAEVGKEFSIESSAMRIDAVIEEMEYGEGGNTYFNKLKVKMDIFLKEGIDLEKPMPIPDQYKS